MKWQWGDYYLEAVQMIVSSLTSTEALTHYDPNLIHVYQFILWCQFSRSVGGYFSYMVR